MFVVTSANPSVRSQSTNINVISAVARTFAVTNIKTIKSVRKELSRVKTPFYFTRARSR